MKPIASALEHRAGQFFACCLLAILSVLAGYAASAVLAGDIARPHLPARFAVVIPSAAANVVMLELTITARRVSQGGDARSICDAVAHDGIRGSGNRCHAGAVVRLRPRGAGAIELGRLSFFGSEQQTYQFSLAPALKKLDRAYGSAEVEVAMISRDGGEPPPDLVLTIEAVRIVTR